MSVDDWRSMLPLEYAGAVFYDPTVSGRENALRANWHVRESENIESGDYVPTLTIVDRLPKSCAADSTTRVVHAVQSAHVARSESGDLYGPASGVNLRKVDPDEDERDSFPWIVSDAAGGLE